ncbi:MAG: DUF2341 domain-containing protein [Asgard group archaeon]|nr:DUF2341 domain-containing protein [Asgard group archaeon]
MFLYFKSNINSPNSWEGLGERNINNYEDFIMLSNRKYKTYLIVTIFLASMIGSFFWLNNPTQVQSISYDWWDDNWSYRREIEISSELPYHLTDYQVLIELTANQFVGRTLSDGNDIRFIADDQSTERSFWIEVWGESGTNRIWVKIPYLPSYSTISIFMYYGNDDLSENQQVVSTSFEEGPPLSNGWTNIEDDGSTTFTQSTEEKISGSYSGCVSRDSSNYYIYRTDKWEGAGEHMSDGTTFSGHVYATHGTSTNAYLYPIFVNWDNYIALRLYSDKVYIESKIGGSYTYTQQSLGTLFYGKWWEFSISIEGSNANAWVESGDHFQSLNHAWSGDPGVGYAALRTRSWWGPYYFDDLELTYTLDITKSNGFDTFPFFDDFNSYATFNSQWDTIEITDEMTHSMDITDGELHVYTKSIDVSSGYLFTTKEWFDMSDFAIHIDARMDNYDYYRGSGHPNGILIKDSDEQWTGITNYCYGDYRNGYYHRKDDSGTSYIIDNGDGDITYDIEVRDSIYWSMEMQPSWTGLISHQDTISGFHPALQIRLYAYLNGAPESPVSVDTYYDTIYLRKYDAHEPTVTLGDEEETMTTIEIIDVEILTIYHNPATDRYEIPKGDTIEVEVWVKNTGTITTEITSLSWKCKSLRSGNELVDIDGDGYIDDLGWEDVNGDTFPYSNNDGPIVLEGTQLTSVNLIPNQEYQFTVFIKPTGYSNGAMNIGEWLLEEISVESTKAETTFYAPINDIGITVFEPFIDNDESNARKVFVENSIAYIADQSSGLEIVDVGNAYGPVELGHWNSYNDKGHAQGVFVSGQYVYKTDSTLGLTSYEFDSNTETLIELDNIPSNYILYNIYVSGYFAYVASWTGGITVYDIRDPYDIQLVSQKNTICKHAYDIDVYGDRLYVASTLEGLLIYDISGNYASNPEFVAQYNDDSYVRCVDVELHDGKTYAFITDTFKGLEIINVDNDLPIYISGFLDGDPKLGGIGQAFDVFVEFHGGYTWVYVTDYIENNGFWMFHVDSLDNDKPKPILRSTYSYNTLSNFDSGIAKSIKVKNFGSPYGLYAFIGDELNGLEVFFINSQTPENMGINSFQYKTTLSDSGKSNSIFVNDYSGNSFVFIADDYDSMDVIEVTNPEAPVFTTKAPNYDGSVQGIFVEENYAYLADSIYGFIVLDINDLSYPKKCGEFLTSNCYDVAIKDNYAYVTNDANGLLILDVSTPSNPELVCQYTQINSAYEIKIQGNYAYITSKSEGVYILDISNPENPTLITNYLYPGNNNAIGLDVSDNFVYIADLIQGMYIIDISSPSTPILQGTFNQPVQAYGVKVDNHMAYITDQNFGNNGKLYIVDISNPQSPVEKDMVSGTNDFLGLYIDGTKVCVIDNEDSLRVYDTGYHYFVTYKEKMNGPHAVFIYYLWSQSTMNDYIEHGHPGGNPRDYFTYDGYGECLAGLNRFKTYSSGTPVLFDFMIAWEDSSWYIPPITGLFGQEGYQRCEYVADYMDMGLSYLPTLLNIDEWHDEPLSDRLQPGHCGFDIAIMYSCGYAYDSFGMRRSNTNVINMCGATTFYDDWQVNIDGVTMHELSYHFGCNAGEPDHPNCDCVNSYGDGGSWYDHLHEKNIIWADPSNNFCSGYADSCSTMINLKWYIFYSLNKIH